MAEMKRGVVPIKWISIIFLAWFASTTEFVGGEVVHLTILTGRQTTIDTETAVYQCYRGEPDGNATLEFGRTANIPSNTAPAPPADLPHRTPEYSLGVRVVTFSDSSWNTDGFGPFYCQGTNAGRDVTRVSTFFTRSDAKFEPSDGVFTRTVNVGDTGVSITMTQVTQPDSQSNVISWRRDGGPRVNLGQLSYQVSDPVQATDEGIYEIHYSTERSSARGSLYRLIVRECAANMWGLPDCVGVCDKCYNGGVCDDQSGLCICPNNFKGPNCLDICRNNGGNRHGLNCEFRCSYLPEDNAGWCGGYLFCLPDPYGCSCETGFKDLACTQACSDGTFGAGCTQSCHCASGVACNIYSGVCPGDCETGWSGDNCQIPDTCDVGYYGSECIDKCHCLDNVACDKTTGECPLQDCAAGYNVYDGQVFCEECRGGFYGLDCAKQCHCADQACHKVTGICNGQCLGQWFQPDCQYGITRVTPNKKVNPLSMVSFTCHVTGNPLPNEGAVNLYRLNGTQVVNDGIVRDHSMEEDGGLAVVFDVNNVYPGDYQCVYTAGQNSASLSTTALTYVLPVLDDPPSLSSVTSSSAILQWSGWTVDDVGDPPIIRYTAYVTRLGGEHWIQEATVEASMTSASVSGLDSDTAYEFSVAAAREGTNGVGPRSPAAIATTLCGMPSASPSGVAVEAVNPRQLQVFWQALPESAFLCRSGENFYRISYSSSGGSAESMFVTDLTSTSLLLTGLQTYLDYTVYVTAGNKDEESARNNPIVVRTAEEIAPPPGSIAILYSTLSSLTVSWSAALPENLNGDIQKYEIQYQPDSDGAGAQAALEEVRDSSLGTQYIIEGLAPEMNYIIMVRTLNGQGASNWSAPAIARTFMSDCTHCSSSSTTIMTVVIAIMAVAIVALSVALAWILLRDKRRSAPTRQRKTVEVDHVYESPVMLSETLKSPGHPENPGENYTELGPNPPEYANTSAKRDDVEYEIPLKDPPSLPSRQKEGQKAEEAEIKL